MKILKNKKLLSKLLISLCLVVMLSSTIMTSVHAKDSDSVVERIGGKLLDATVNLFVGIGDGVMGMLQKALMGQETSLIEIQKSQSGWKALFIGIILVVGVIGVIAIIASAGAAIGAAGTLGKIALVAGTAGKIVSKVIITAGALMIVNTSLVENVINGALNGKALYLPLYEVTPYEIFSNKINILDFDFFDPKENTTFTYEKNQDVLNNQSKVVKDSYTGDVADVIGKFDLLSRRNGKLNWNYDSWYDLITKEDGNGKIVYDNDTAARVVSDMYNVICNIDIEVVKNIAGNETLADVYCKEIEQLKTLLPKAEQNMKQLSTKVTNENIGMDEADRLNEYFMATFEGGSSIFPDESIIGEEISSINAAVRRRFAEDQEL